jgi:hypothetical protein
VNVHRSKIDFTDSANATNVVVSDQDQNVHQASTMWTKVVGTRHARMIIPLHFAAAKSQVILNYLYNAAIAPWDSAEQGVVYVAEVRDGTPRAVPLNPVVQGCVV